MSDNMANDVEFIENKQELPTIHYVTPYHATAKVNVMGMKFNIRGNVTDNIEPKPKTIEPVLKVAKVSPKCKASVKDAVRGKKHMNRQQGIFKIIRAFPDSYWHHGSVRIPVKTMTDVLSVMKKVNGHYRAKFIDCSHPVVAVYDN